MSHVPNTNLHRYVGDHLLLRIVVDGLPTATEATWICGGLTKTELDGITLFTENGTAVLEVELSDSDTSQLGPGVFRWQAAAAGVLTTPLVVSEGHLTLSPRLESDD